MCREIRFRGYFNGNTYYPTQKWVYGGIVFRDSGVVQIIEDCNGHTLVWDVDPDSVGQYLGLKDKNGREVYEKAIVTEGGGVHVIEWNNDAARFEYKNKTGSAGLYCFYGEVIGNIYENPELLENSEDSQ